MPLQQAIPEAVVPAASKLPGWSPVPDLERPGLVGVPPAIQQNAARQVIARCQELGNPSRAEVTDVLVIVVASILEMQITPGMVIDARAQSELGRRLLELMRDEVMRSWRDYAIDETELPVLLLAIERVLDAIANRDVHSLAAQLGGGDGLNLLADVAHDMRSPLASILFLAETLQRGDVSDVQREQLGLICTAALGLSSVGNDIIDLTRSELLLEPTPVPFSVTSVLHSVRDIVRPIAAVKKLEVRIEPPQVPERLGHAVALTRVLLNLTTNALKFTEHGFVELTASDTKPGWTEFSVRDSGRGIDPAMMPTLFDPVRHVARRQHEVRGTKLFSNTGLGLTICRKLTEAMGAQLRVETHLGQGTRFFFELELPECPSHRKPGRNSGPDPNHPGRRHSEQREQIAR